MSERKRKIFTGAQKAKVVLEAVKGTKTINEIAQEQGVHTNQVSQWKKELLESAGSLFEGKRGPKLINGKRHRAVIRQDWAIEHGTGLVSGYCRLQLLQGCS